MVHKLKTLIDLLLGAFSKNYLLILLLKSEKQKLKMTIKDLSKAQMYLSNRSKDIWDKTVSRLSL